jgi:murein L,D-transpeptidase YafK
MLKGRLQIRFVAAGLCGAVVLSTGVDTKGSPDMLPKVDLVTVEKGARSLSLFSDGAVVKSYRIALGFNPEGHKVREGDGRTPEGRYIIDTRNTESRYHLSLRISYPDRRDIARAANRNVPPGGDIFIHGLPNGRGGFGSTHRSRDWTAGCIAVTNTEIEEIWAAVADGTPIEIRP